MEVTTNSLFAFGSSPNGHVSVEDGNGTYGSYDMEETNILVFLSGRLSLICAQWCATALVIIILNLNAKQERASSHMRINGENENNDRKKDALTFRIIATPNSRCIALVPSLLDWKHCEREGSLLLS